MAAARQYVNVYPYDVPGQRTTKIPPKLLVAPEVSHNVFTRCRVRDEELEQFMINSSKQTTQDDRHRAILLQITYAMMHIHTCGFVAGGNITTRNIRLSKDGKNVILGHFSCQTTASGTLQQDIACLGTVFRFVLCRTEFRDEPLVSGCHLLKSVEDPQTACGLINQISNLSSTREVLAHPFFLSKRKKLDFLADVWLLAKCRKPFKNDINENLAGYSNWSGHLRARPPPYGNPDVHAVSKFAENYDSKHPASLLAFMRNLREHYWDAKSENVRKIICNDTDAFWDFFHSRFPNLFYETYTVVKKRKTERDVLKKEYFDKIAEYINLPE